ncbi:MAG: hypothetical protein ACLTER_17315 [Ruminococcus sp.]
MHNFKKIVKTVLVLAVCITLLVGLDMALYPCTFMRNDIHAVVNNQYDDIILGTSHGMTDIDPAVMEEITGRTGHNMCVGGEYVIDAYHIAKLIAEKRSLPELFMKWIRNIWFPKKKKETIIFCFITSFLSQKLNWNISGILLRTAISELFCFRGMNIHLAMSLEK